MKLNEFLVKAKKSGYASKGEDGELALVDGGKKLVYNEGVFKYRDRYFGFNPFAGEEAVWESDKVIWVMNYYGIVVSDELSVKKVYSFLKDCLKEVGLGSPYRGPKSFEQDKFKYVNSFDGSIERFIGEEQIFYEGEEIYKCNYHGGLVN